MKYTKPSVKLNPNETLASVHPYLGNGFSGLEVKIMYRCPECTKKNGKETVHKEGEVKFEAHKKYDRLMGEMSVVK